MDSVTLWTPPTKIDRNIAYARFVERVTKKHNVQINSYWDLHKWSVDYYDKFWAEVYEFSQIISSGDSTQVVDLAKKINEVPKWFPNVRLNYAENLMKHNDDAVAIYFTSEASRGTDIRRVTFGELKRQVKAYAGGLKALGVKSHDRIAGVLPNCPESVFAMLGAASLGAVWVSSSPDFGVEAVIERFGQVKPKILFAVDAVIYNQKLFDQSEKLKEILKQLPSVERLLLIPFVQRDINKIPYKTIPKCLILNDFLVSSDRELEFERVPFDHPLFIMFSSGTTGAPKCLVHSVGGTLLKHVAEHVLQECLTGSDILFFYTTIAWMMWNWLVSALATGAAIVLYDGSPFVPQPALLFDLVDKIGITFMGMGAKCYQTFESKGLNPMKSHRLSSLRALLSTGSPLIPSSYDYVYKSIKQDVVLGSISGGTDIIACFMGMSWVVPVHRGEIQVPYLGCAIECFNDEGQAVLGERGELVCLKPFPSMPTHFLNDTDGVKYRRAYFDSYPHIWTHGDYCLRNPSTGGILMLGRSDGTLNPGGVRFGSAEIYHIVEKFPEIADSLCVGQKLANGDERVILFVKMRNGCIWDEQLLLRLRQNIRQGLSARHVPHAILPVEDIPYTTNGKKVEVAVKKILAGEPVTNRSVLANPESLDLYINLAILLCDKSSNLPTLRRDSTFDDGS